MLSREDVAGYNMELTNACILDEVPLFNVLSVIEGKVLNDVGESTDTIAGEVIIAMPESRTTSLFPGKNTIAICGNQPDIIRSALEINVNCLILCRTELDKEFYDIPTTTCIISTPYDAYKTSRLIFQSTPIGRICRTEDLTCFHLEDRVDEVKELVLKHRESCYPILDTNEKVVGVLTRYHLLRPRRKRVVLVDHNEAAQSVPGLDEAEIVEIIDHHRVADIQTSNPIFVRNEPVGSTNTIIAGMFQDKGLIPSEKLAGLIAAAILSDTVMFKSPTCTVRDIRTAERMARYANISLNELGKLIFSASFEGKTIKELLFTDYKEFHIAGHDLAVAQITCVDSSNILERKEEFLKEMHQIAEKKQVSMINPTVYLSAKGGGVPQSEKAALTDEQAQQLLDAVRGLPPYVFVMLGLYAGLRREEILGLQWDSVYLDADAPFLTVRRAWHTEHNRPVILSELKTNAAERNIPLPVCLVNCLREAKATSTSEYVVANRDGEPLSYTQFKRLWQYIVTRSTKERSYYRYEDGVRVKHTVKPVLGEKAAHNGKVVYSLDFEVTPHQLRHTYITNLIHASVDPKTVQYLAGHENSKITMDIYAKVKYNRPDDVVKAMGGAFAQWNAAAG